MVPNQAIQLPQSMWIKLRFHTTKLFGLDRHPPISIRMVLQVLSHPHIVQWQQAGKQRVRQRVQPWVWSCLIMVQAQPHPWVFSSQEWIVYPKPNGASYPRIIYIYINNTYMYNTSSATQGGGESFENRKPIGELGCCESRMAERIHWWAEMIWNVDGVFLQWLQWLQWSPGRSPHPQLLDVVWRSAAVVVAVV